MEKRDLRVIDGLEKHRYLRTDQIAELYFQAVKNPAQRISKARARLLKLHKGKLVKRARYPGEAYIYFIQGKADSRKLQHYLAITDVLLQILPQLPAGSKVDYDIEVKNGDVITDLAIHYKNDFRNEQKTYYVEVELDSTGDVAQKIKAYEEIVEGDDTLLIVCKHRRTEAKILGEKFMIKVKTCLLDNVVL